MSWTSPELHFTDRAEFTCAMEQLVQLQEHDHTKLVGREEPDQHPMGAITGLDTALERKLSAAGALTNLELEALLS